MMAMEYSLNHTYAVDKATPMEVVERSFKAAIGENPHLDGRNEFAALSTLKAKKIREDLAKLKHHFKTFVVPLCTNQKVTEKNRLTIQH